MDNQIIIGLIVGLSFGAILALSVYYYMASKYAVPQYGLKPNKIAAPISFIDLCHQKDRANNELNEAIANKIFSDMQMGIHNMDKEDIDLVIQHVNDIVYHINEAQCIIIKSQYNYETDQL